MGKEENGLAARAALETAGSSPRQAAKTIDVTARAALEVAGSSARQAPKAIDIAEARRTLRVILSSGTAVGKLTIAARNENELSDADILTMIANLRELGLWPEDKDNS